MSECSDEMNDKMHEMLCDAERSAKNRIDEGRGLDEAIRLAVSTLDFDQGMIAYHIYNYPACAFLFGARGDEGAIDFIRSRMIEELNAVDSLKEYADIH